MRWFKKMSQTDAQQPTTGRVVPYLRFIKGRNIHNNQVWFRRTFFGGQKWTNGQFGKHVVEECNVEFNVSINGVSKGKRIFHITHDDTRAINNSTPNTWLHYDQATLADMQKTNLRGKTFSVEKIGNDYFLDIS